MSKYDHLLSDELRKERRRFADFRHGGVVMLSEDVEGLVKQLDLLIEAADALEDTVGTLKLMKPSDRVASVSASSATILQMQRPGSNVYEFPGNPNA